MDKNMRIVAEIGTAHRGSLKEAETLIRQAAKSGADCAKFQIVFAHEILHPNTGLVDLPGGATPLYSVFESLENDISFYKSLKEICQAENIAFQATPFGLESARMLKKLSPDDVKIASPELNYTQLIQEVASWDLPIVLSSGVSLLSDIEEALMLIDQGVGRDQTTLLHCVTSYPAPEEEYNLALLPHLKSLFGVEVGVSDHSMDPCLVPGLALQQGASMVEKHFTLSRSGDGLDDPIALDPEAFTKMVDYIHELEELGDSDAMYEKLCSLYGREKVLAVLGRGQKVLAPCEAESYGRTNRSIHALSDLKAGDVLSLNNCAVLRTERILKPGMHPRYLEEILGKQVTTSIEAGQGIGFTDLLQ